MLGNMDISWILTAIAGVLIIYVVYGKFSKKQSYWEKRGVPCNKQSILSLSTLLFPKKPLSDAVVDAYRGYDGEKYYGYTIFNTPVLTLRDPELINLVLIKDFSYFQDRNVPMGDTTELLNSGLANITGDKWRVLRHKLTPSFTSGKMKSMFKQIKECSDEFVQFLKLKNGRDLETRDVLFKFMINVIGSIAFGIKADAFNEKTEKDNEFLDMSRRFFKPSLLLQLKLTIFLVAPKWKDFLGIKLIDDKVNTFFPKFVQALINYRKTHSERRDDFLQLMIDQQEKEQTIVNASNLDAKDNHGSSASLKAEREPEDIELLDHLKNLNYDNDALVFSDNIIAAQSFLFISGGSDTTAAILSFVLHYLAINQDSQRKLQNEIDHVLSTHEFDNEAVKKMKYLEQVLYEVLRLHVPNLVLTRMCVQDYKMPGCELVIEKGTIVQVPTSAIHRDPQYFPDPEKFNPDRFDDMDSIPKGVFFPFGGGPRMCIAMRLATLEMKVFVATVMKTFNVLHSEKTPLPLVYNKTSFSQQVKDGLWVKFEERR